MWSHVNNYGAKYWLCSSDGWQNQIINIQLKYKNFV